MQRAHLMWQFYADVEGKARMETARQFALVGCCYFGDAKMKDVTYIEQVAFQCIK